jgi:hypothetical protein
MILLPVSGDSQNKEAGKYIDSRVTRLNDLSHSTPLLLHLKDATILILEIQLVKQQPVAILVGCIVCSAEMDSSRAVGCETAYRR